MHLISKQLARLALCAAMFPAPAMAQEMPPFIACSLPLPPHTMPGPDGKPSGYATQTLQAVARRAGWSVSVRYMPWLRVVDEAQRGKCDLVYTVLKRTDYEAFLVFPKEPLQMRANVLLVMRGRGIRYDGDLASFMRRHSVGLYRDKAVNDSFEALRHAPWARVDEAVDAHQNMLKLLAGRFDAAIENEQTAIHELKAIGREQDVEVLKPALNEVAAYVAFPKAGRLAGQAAVFDRAMREFKSTSASMTR